MKSLFLSRLAKKGFRKHFIPKKIGRFGFTLIEILIVVAIIGILSMFVVVASTKSTAKARDAVRKSDLGLMASALEQYYVDYGFNYIANYYDSTSGLNIWVPGLESYFKRMPKDVKQASVPQYMANEPKVGRVAGLHTVTLRPNGPGNRVGVSCSFYCNADPWQSQVPASGSHWDKLDENSSDENGSYIESSTDAQWDGYTHNTSGIPAGSTISSVKICLRAMSNSPDPEYDPDNEVWISEPRIAAPAIISGNILYYDDYEINVSYSNVCRESLNNPNGNVAWTVAAVDSAQIAMRKSYGTHTRVTQAWMEVTYGTASEGSPINGTVSGPPCADYGTKYRFTATYNDPEGAGTILYAYIMINDAAPYDTTTTPQGAFAAVLNNQANDIGVRNDPNTSWNWAPSGINGNSYADLDRATTTYSASGTTLTVNWDVTFKNAWQAETANVWLKTVDTSNNVADYTSVSALQIPCTIIIGDPPGDPPPSGSGSGDYFYAYYSDASGSFYEVWARLEDLGDPEINTKSTAVCKRSVPAAVPATFNYCMSSRL